MWKRLVHPNIVPFRGITVTPLQLISDWMSGGDLTGYINQHPGVDRLGLVGFSLLRPSEVLTRHQLDDIVEGLHYLHSHNVVHGDLKGVCVYPKFRSALVLIPNQPNVLVDDTGHARITDFGFAVVTHNLDIMWGALPGDGHTARWTAPEILTGKGANSKEADVFSFAMVVIEVSREQPTGC